MPEFEARPHAARETAAAGRSAEEIQEEERRESRNARSTSWPPLWRRDENCFPALMEAVEVCSLGQISGRLQEVVGRFRPMV